MRTHLQIASSAARLCGFGVLLLASTAAPIAAQPAVGDVAITPAEPRIVGEGENLRNILLVKDFYRAAAKGDFAAVTALLAPDVTETFGSQTTRGPQGVIDNIKGIVAGFPDLQLRLTSIMAQEDQIVVRWTATGTHKGTFVGIPPTNKHASTTGVDIFRVKDGKIVEHQTYMDLLRLLEELQIIKRRG